MVTTSETSDPCGQDRVFLRSPGTLKARSLWKSLGAISA